MYVFNIDIPKILSNISNVVLPNEKTDDFVFSFSKDDDVFFVPIIILKSINFFSTILFWYQISVPTAVKRSKMKISLEIFSHKLELTRDPTEPGELYCM